MKNFFQWAEEKNFDLSFLDSLRDQPTSEKAATESSAAKRAAPSANYPDAYGRAQYPALHFTTAGGDAPYKFMAKPKKVPDTQP
jgi:hypothetical protein